MSKLTQLAVASTLAIATFGAVATTAETANAGDRRASAAQVRSRSLLHSGLWTFTGSYVPAVVVAAVSPYQFDQALYIPVAGPWIDLASRDCPSCNHEVVNRVLLVGSGIFQAVGAINIVTSLFVPRVSYSAADAPSDTAQLTSISPTQMGQGGFGAIARGTF